VAARPRGLSRRGLLGACGLAGLLAGCGTSTEATTPKRTASARGRHYYGDDHANQFADLALPKATLRGTVVLLHGGYWLPGYGLDLMRPLAVRLNALGFATWNVEYRRTGAGGGYPATLSDVAAAIDLLADRRLPSGLTERVVLLGHSAGGHLAGWAASRSSATPGGPAKVTLGGAVSLSGVLDLTRAASDPRSSGPVTSLMGGSPTEQPERYALADPARLVPASCPVWAVHAEDDTVVSADQSTSYVRLARAAGGRAVDIPVPGDHFTLIDPRAASFPTISRLLSTATA
jgi:acetyl esterase/lipase